MPEKPPHGSFKPFLQHLRGIQSLGEFVIHFCIVILKFFCTKANGNTTSEVDKEIHQQKVRKYVAARQRIAINMKNAC